MIIEKLCKDCLCYNCIYRGGCSYQILVTEYSCDPAYTCDKFKDQDRG